MVYNEVAHTPDFNTHFSIGVATAEPNAEMATLNNPLFGNYFPVGAAAQVSSGVPVGDLSVNNRNKECTCHWQCVPLRQSTCHQVARLVPPPPLSSCYWLFAGVQIRRLSAMGNGESGASEDQHWIPLTQPAPPTIAASDSFA